MRVLCAMCNVQCAFNDLPSRHAARRLCPCSSPLTQSSILPCRILARVCCCRVPLLSSVLCSVIWQRCRGEEGETRPRASSIIDGGDSLPRSASYERGSVSMAWSPTPSTRQKGHISEWVDHIAIARGTRWHNNRDGMDGWHREKTGAVGSRMDCYRQTGGWCVMTTKEYRVHHERRGMRESTTMSTGPSRCL